MATKRKSNQTAVDKTITTDLAAAAGQVVQATSRPTLVGNLRSTWRKSAEHAVEQLSRFIRLTVIAAIPSVVNLVSGGKFDWRTLLAFILPFAEVSYRQMFPALGAAAVDSAPGATIVPAEVAPTDTAAEGDAAP